MKLLLLYALFFRFGLLCFGGGYVLTPVYIDALINTRGWMTLAEFGDLLAITQITPGPVSINAATFFGYGQAGIPGTIAATAGLLTPSLLLLTVVLHSLRRWAENPILKGMMWGVSPVTYGLMATVILIFAERSIFDGAIPWSSLHRSIRFSAEAGLDTVRIRPVAAVICAAVTLALCRSRLTITTLVLLAAAAGALIIPLVGG